MPFVSDIAGPQQPVESSPPLVTGALRRTSTIDTHPAGDDDSVVDLRASDVVGRGPPRRACSAGSPSVRTWPTGSSTTSPPSRTTIG